MSGVAYRGCWISEVGASARGRVRDTMSVCDKIYWGPARMGVGTDTENPEGRDKLKVSGGIQTPRRKIEGSGARNTDDGGVAPKEPMAIVRCRRVKGMNGTKKAC